MSYRYANAIVKPGLNTLVAPPPPTFLYNLYSWGANNSGQLGLNNTTYYSSPKQVDSLTTWSKITGGNQYALSIKTDGTMWSWGDNGSGQLGLGDATQRNSPVQIGALTTWLNVSVGYRSSFAIKTDGTLWSWGRNSAGQLGLGDTTSRSSPVQVGALTTWSTLSVSPMAVSFFAIKTDGTLWAWGQGTDGQLGLGNLTNKSSPNQVGGDTNWLKVAAGRYHTLAVKTNGTLWSFGYGGYGSLGLGNTLSYSSPKQVGALTTWLNVSASYASSFAIKADGTIWGWGTNSSGQLGQGNTTNRSSPVQIGALTNWLTVPYTSGVYQGGMAIKTDGTLWGWGVNGAGQLGQGNTTSTSSPVQVGTSTTWLSVVTLDSSTLAIG
jgi:alpha-tubulin suppressor-like RCC1 family protein